MRSDDVTDWFARREFRQHVLLHLAHPMTASQLAPQLETPQGQCSRVLRALTQRGLARCLNPAARRSRVYELTPLGEKHQRQLCHRCGQPGVKSAFPDVDWSLYGWVCFSHRSAILRAMEQPLQPATIKRIARHQNEDLRMSANNVRDVIRLFVEKGIAKALTEGKRSHPRYELTERGRALQAVLLGAGSPASNIEHEPNGT